MHPPGPVPVCWWPSALPFARLLLGKTTTCSRFISYWWFGTKRRRQILCTGAVITLPRIIPIYSVGAEVVAIMRQNTPFVDLVKSPKAVFIDFFAWSRSLLWSPTLSRVVKNSLSEISRPRDCPNGTDAVFSVVDRRRACPMASTIFFWIPYPKE